MSSESKRVSTEVKLEFACAVISGVAAFLFYRAGSANIASALLGMAGGTALGGYLGLAKHFEWFGAPKQ